MAPIEKNAWIYSMLMNIQYVNNSHSISLYHKVCTVQYILYSSLKYFCMVYDPTLFLYAGLPYKGRDSAGLSYLEAATFLWNNKWSRWTQRELLEGRKNLL